MKKLQATLNDASAKKLDAFVEKYESTGHTVLSDLVNFALTGEQKTELPITQLLHKFGEDETVVPDMYVEGSAKGHKPKTPEEIEMEELKRAVLMLQSQPAQKPKRKVSGFVWVGLGVLVIVAGMYHFGVFGAAKNKLKSLKIPKSNDNSPQPS